MSHAGQSFELVEHHHGLRPQSLLGTGADRDHVGVLAYEGTLLRVAHCELHRRRILPQRQINPRHRKRSVGRLGIDTRRLPVLRERPLEVAHAESRVAGEVARACIIRPEPQAGLQQR